MIEPLRFNVEKAPALPITRPGKCVCHSSSFYFLLSTLGYSNVVFVYIHFIGSVTCVWFVSFMESLV